MLRRAVFGTAIHLIRGIVAILVSVADPSYTDAAPVEALELNRRARGPR